MSILLNALNKSKLDQDSTEEIEELIDSPIEEVTVDDSNVSHSSHALVWLLSLISVLLLAILLVLIWDKLATNQKPTVEQTSVSEVVSTKELEANSIAPTNNETHIEEATTAKDRYFESFQIEKQPRTVKKQSSPKKEKVVRSVATPPAVTAAQSSSDNNESLSIRELNDLSDVEKMMVSEVTIGAHVYSDDNAQSFIFSNDELKQEGDKLINSWTLEKIEEKSIVISNGILRVRVPIQN